MPSSSDNDDYCTAVQTVAKLTLIELTQNMSTGFREPICYENKMATSWLALFQKKEVLRSVIAGYLRASWVT